MNRHQLLHVYTGLRAELDRLVFLSYAGSSVARGMALQTGIIADISELTFHGESEEPVQDEVH